VGAAVRFSAAEATRTAGAPSAVFYLIASISLVALLLARRATGSLGAAHIAFAAVLVLLIDIAFLRDVIAARVPDVVAPTTIVIAWLAGRFVPPRAASLAGGAGVIAAVAVTGFLLARDGYGFPAPTDVVRQWRRVSDRLRRTAPEIATTPPHAALEAYAQRCTAADDRILTSGFGPEIPVLARRPFAGGLPTWIPGYYTATPDITRALAQLRRERVGLVVMLDGTPAFMRSWPQLAGSLEGEGFKPYSARTAGSMTEVWLPARAVGAPIDEDTGLPCANRSR
jgi:hypothetical protein